MNQYTLITDYKNRETYRRSFNQLANQVFEIDFECWYQKGFWNDRYLCYSYWDGKRIVANVSVNKVALSLKGERQTAIMLGTVMTHPDCRGQGLARRLMELVLAEYENQVDLIYLFANQQVREFYPKFGFTARSESLFAVEIELKPEHLWTGQLRKLDLSQAADLELFTRLAEERLPALLGEFVVVDASHILYWYGLNLCRDFLYYSKSLDSILIYKSDQGLIILYDVISRREVAFHELIRQIGVPGTNQVEFYFTPGFRDIEPETAVDLNPDDQLFVRPGLKYDGPFKYPFSAKA